MAQRQTEMVNKAFLKCPTGITQPPFAVDEDLKEKLTYDFRVIPQFEKSVYDHIYKKHYSLETNEKMKCRWREYKNNIADHVKVPVQFPDIRDQHFYHNMIRYIPSVSEFRKTDLRKKLKPGPGVDFIGQIPIPQELIMKRGIQQKDKTLGRKVRKESKTSDVKVDPGK